MSGEAQFVMFTFPAKANLGQLALCDIVGTTNLYMTRGELWNKQELIKYSD